jgi:hypothetical protein
VVKTVKSWRELAQYLMGWYDFEGSYGRKKLDAIEDQHLSDEARLKALVEEFLLGEGLIQPSWRILIHVLHKADESHLIEMIKTNAEPHQGEWALRELTHNVCTLAYWGQLL